MLCIIGNMPTYVTNLHRLAGNILSANGREMTRKILDAPRIARIGEYLLRTKQELDKKMTGT